MRILFLYFWDRKVPNVVYRRAQWKKRYQILLLTFFVTTISIHPWSVMNKGHNFAFQTLTVFSVLCLMKYQKLGCKTSMFLLPYKHYLILASSISPSLYLFFYIAKFVAWRCAFCKLWRIFGFFCSVNHLSRPLRKQMFTCSSSKGHGLWIVIGGFWSVLFVLCFKVCCFVVVLFWAIIN